MAFFQRLGVTAEEIEQMIQASPSLRGVFIGYLAEKKLIELHFPDHPPKKYDDHNRKKKGDRWIIYKGHELSIEVKSLQTNSVKQTAKGCTGAFQCDASDSRKVTFADGSTVTTVCLHVGEFDLLAINLFEFGQKWHFAFIKNADLPKTKSRKYNDYQKQFLLQTTPKITWPLQPPFSDDPWKLLDEIVEAKNASTTSSSPVESSQTPESTSDSSGRAPASSDDSPQGDLFS
jgi:hypothetical protein